MRDMAEAVRLSCYLGPVMLEKQSKPRPRCALFYLLALFLLVACGGDGNPRAVNELSDAVAPPTPEAPPQNPPEEEPPRRQVARDFTYHGHTRDIIERKCTTCHVEGDIAPFALDTLDRVRQFSAAMAFSIRAGAMPPWPPTPGYTPFEQDRSLSPEEKFILLHWLENGMPEGDPGDYTRSAVSAPNPTADSRLQHDIALPMPQAYTPFLQPDDHRCFALEWPLDEFAYVTGVDVVPGVKEEVHHVIVSVAEPEYAHLYFAASGEDGRPGWYCLGAGGVSGAPLPRQIGGWVPGVGREPTPQGTGMGVRPGSVVVVQMHYNTLIAEPQPDLSTVMIATAEEVQRPARSFLLTNPTFLLEGGMRIPAGESNVTHAWSVPAAGLALLFGEEIGIARQDSWVMHQGFLHMHNLGTRGRTTLKRRGGSEQVLLDIRDWDFNWQGTYNFVEEVLVQPGDQITISCSWDNSQANQAFVNGVQLRARDVEWGDGTQDEMCLMSVYMTKPLPGKHYSHSPSVYIESPTYLQAFEPGDLVPLRLILNNFSLHDPDDHSHDNASKHGGDHSAVYAGHYHLYLDTDDDGAEHLTAWDDRYYYRLPDDLEQGIHEIRVSLRAPDHHPLGVEQRVEIEVLEQNETPDRRLVDANRWVYQAAQEDSLVSHRPGNADCPDNSWYNEDGALEVETGYCGYLSLAQPSLADIVAGDQVHLVLWHGALASEEAAVAHVAISVAGEIIWENSVEIPGDADIFDTRVSVPFDAPAGSKVEYHLHNHGFNTWTLLQLEVER